MKYGALLLICACLSLVSCQSARQDNSAASQPLRMQSQCYVNVNKSAENCEFMNQGNPEGLQACRKVRSSAASRCERMTD